jgi:lambda repressor-like predicted transcriptional regulator
MIATDLDAVRALILARVEQAGLSLTELSKSLGRNQAYLQQYLRRGIPRVLPEDVREALAAALGLPADALRNRSPGKGGPMVAPPDAIAQTEMEQNLLRLFRQMSASEQAKALGILRALT